MVRMRGLIHMQHRNIKHDSRPCVVWSNLIGIYSYIRQRKQGVKYSFDADKIYRSYPKVSASFNVQLCIWYVLNRCSKPVIIGRSTAPEKTVSCQDRYCYIIISDVLVSFWLKHMTYKGGMIISQSWPISRKSHIYYIIRCISSDFSSQFDFDQQVCWYLMRLFEQCLLAILDIELIFSLFS